MNHPSLRIRLLYREKVIAEICSSDLTEEVQIGRSSSCNWKVPPEDKLISSHHAALTRQGSAILLRDLGSTNGTFFKGQRIKEKKLKPGYRFALGHCFLTVETDLKQTNAAIVPELQVLSGKRRKTRQPIQKDRLTIGTDLNSDLLLTDDLVSRAHAVVIRKEDESCWLKALSTTNGTRVNDALLPPDQERLLKDGDRIFLAHVEIEFRDGTKRQDHGLALRQLGVMAAAAVVCTLLYFGWQVAQGPAAGEIRKARDLKEAGQFGQAMKRLDSAIDRRGYRDVQPDADTLRRQIIKSEASFQHWQTTQARLQQEDWKSAGSQLGELSYNDTDAWGWREGQQVRQRARQVKTWLDAYLDAGHPESLSLDVLKARNQGLAGVIKDLESQPDLKVLRKAAVERQHGLMSLLQAYQGLDEALRPLRQHEGLADPTGALGEIERYATNSASSVMQKAQGILPPLRQLAAGYGRLLEALANARELRFQQAQMLKPELPTPDECVFDVSLSEFRRNLDNSWGNFLRDLPRVAQLTETLVHLIGKPDIDPAELLFWRDAGALDKILNCDSLTARFPSRSRTAGQGEYDQALCIEWFYTSLRDLADQRQSEGAEPRFECRLHASVRMLEAARAMAGFFPGAKQERSYWLGGKVKQWDATARRILQLRDRIAEELQQRARLSSGRESVIAAGIAWHLMGRDNQDKPFREPLAENFQSVRKAVQLLYDQRDSSNALQRIELRKKILAIGLPGDPKVNQMWVESDSTGMDAGKPSRR